MGSRESVADFARVISQYVDALAVRTYAHSTVEELARYATVPIVNALSDLAHPCQAMADMLTIRESRGRLDGVSLVFVGDGNNVARSLALASGLLGRPVRAGVAPGLRVPRRLPRGLPQEVPRRPAGGRPRPEERPDRRRRGLHRRLGEHGPGARGRRPAARRSPRSRSTRR